ASQLILESRSLAKRAGDRIAEAKAIHWMALIAGETGNPLEVVRLSPEVLVVAEELGLQELEGTCRTTLGLAFLALGRFDEAKREFEARLAMNVELHDVSSIGISQDNLGHVARAQGHYEEALAWYKSALGNSREAQHLSEIDEELEAVGSVFVA